MLPAGTLTDVQLLYDVGNHVHAAVKFEKSVQEMPVVLTSHLDFIATGTSHVLVVTRHSDSTTCIEGLQFRNRFIHGLGMNPI